MSRRLRIGPKYPIGPKLLGCNLCQYWCAENYEDFKVILCQYPFNFYDNTYKDFVYNESTCNINNYNITNIFLIAAISKVIYKKNQLLVMPL